MFTASKEDYLRAIYHLMEENSEVRSVDVADYLDVKKPSVSEMLKNLNNDGLIQYRKYSRIKLTKKGLDSAKNLTARHRIIETFLNEMLNINKKSIHEEAHRLEHAFSNESIEKIRRLLHNPKTDPHGKPIPI